MKEIHPSVSVSAMGNYLDEQVEIAALARHYYEEEGCPEGRAEEHWLRAEREIYKHSLPAQKAASPGTDADLQTEEVMHLDQ